MANLRDGVRAQSGEFSGFDIVPDLLDRVELVAARLLQVLGPEEVALALAVFMSVLLAMLMHASLDAFWLSATPPGLTAVPLVTWYLAWAALLWILVAAVAVANRGKLSRQMEPGWSKSRARRGERR